MSGHRYESLTPYPWVGEMQAAIGGSVFTVNDDIHGSVPFVPECAAHLATYFTTGHPDTGQCQGVAAPTGSDALSPLAEAAVRSDDAGTLPTGTRWSWR